MKTEKGGFAVGLIVGLLIGLTLALAVALYVTKAPMPFVNKVPSRTPTDDAAEIERNRNWDPNAPLAGKPVKPILNNGSASGSQTTTTVSIPPASPASAAEAVLPPGAAPAPPLATVPEPKAATAPKSQRDPAAILAGQSPLSAPTSGPKSSKGGGETFTYFVQAGAFARTEDAELQRARLAMMGLSARVTEREQSGRTVYRVRLGPFERKEDADAAQERLQSSGVDAALVRVEN
ncbi:MAG TPA: SPOR domain-containing protein [Burkholderiaceae bacterium]|nr:SPOR domain-containing protein [Burkholderiaceae bacterium]